MGLLVLELLNFCLLEDFYAKFHDFNKKSECSSLIFILQNYTLSDHALVLSKSRIGPGYPSGVCGLDMWYVRFISCWQGRRDFRLKSIEGEDFGVHARLREKTRANPKVSFLAPMQYQMGTSEVENACSRNLFGNNTRT